MLGKKYRLTRKQINQLYRKGKSRNAGLLGIKFAPNNLEYSRYAVVIPKKVVALPTDRNRLKRIIYQRIEETKPSQNSDIIIRVFKAEDEAIISSKIKEILCQ